MLPRDQSSKASGSNEARKSPNVFERNKYRQTMPSNSRYNPLSPPGRNPISKFHAENTTASPTQSHTSVMTNYAAPWSSPKFQAPATPKNRERTEEPRFRRTHSVATRKAQQDEQKKSERPKINFMDFRKKIANRFKKGDQKKGPGGNVRLSAPVISLAEASSSQSQLSSTSSTAASSSSASATTKNNIKVSSSQKMQPEDRMKMYQKMGREQAMKVSSVQRMQRERQRDFSIVPGVGRACLEANPSLHSSIHSVDSVVSFSSHSKESTSLSMTDDDVEPIFKNSLTQRNVTSSQVAAIKNKNSKLANGPSFTSTPKVPAAPSESPTISNVRSISESSFCLITSDEITPNVIRSGNPNQTNDTMYYSTVGPVGNGMITPSNEMISSTSKSICSIAPSTASTPTVRIKQEAVDNDCPSIASTPFSEQENPYQAQTHNIQAAHLNCLWEVSKEIREKQLLLEGSVPALERMTARFKGIDEEKSHLIDTKMENPSLEDLRRMWELHVEHRQLTKDMGITNMNIMNASQMLPHLEMRRNELLANSSPQMAPMNMAGSLV